MKVTPVFDWNYQTKKRYVVNQGGTWSGKTYNIIPCLIAKVLEEDKEGDITTVTAAAFPDLRGGALRDFQAIVADSEINQYLTKTNLGEHKYTFQGGGAIEFRTFRDAKAAEAGKRKRLFINEVNNVDYMVSKKLILKTAGQVYMDFNPTSDFWAHEELLSSEEAQWIYSTYRDNPFVPQSVINEIESLSPELYAVYGLGKRGTLAGQVFTNVMYVNEMPKYFAESRFFIDYGYSVSPSAVGFMGLANGQIYAKELIYERGLNEYALMKKVREIKGINGQTVVVDAANQSLISLLREYNINAVSNPKPKVEERVSLMKRFKWNIHNDSLNWKKEAKNYLYKRDAGGGFLNVPNKEYDHLWDGAGYALLDIFGNKIPAII